MNFFLFSPQITESDVTNKIASSLNLLSVLQRAGKDDLINRLKSRIFEFEQALALAQANPTERRLILEQFDRFANALHRCLTNPEQHNASIRHYLNTLYYPVGVTEVTKPSRQTMVIAKSGLFVGLSLLAGSIPAFVLNPVAGAIMLAVAVSILLPSCYFLLIPESPDVSKKKESDRLLLKQGAIMIKPDLPIEEMIKANDHPLSIPCHN